MVDFNKIFQVGNIIGVYDGNGLSFVGVIDIKNIEEWKQKYQNYSLSYGNAKIQWVSKVNDTGESIEKIFDRKRDISNELPEIKNGMIVRTYVPASREPSSKLGIVVDDKIVYTSGGWNNLKDFDEYGNRVNVPGVGILNVYQTCDLDNCIDATCIWSKED